MYGQITKFDETLQVGVIAADDGRRFRFIGAEVVNFSETLAGHEVDFVLGEPGGRPSKIILLTGTPWQVFGAIGPADNGQSRGSIYEDWR